MPKEKCYFIWWVNQACYRALPEMPDEAPKYLKEQYHDREGRPGRCRLWISRRFKDFGISPWPETPFTLWLEKGDFAGIAVDDSSATISLLSELPGILTKVDLSRVGA